MASRFLLCGCFVSIFIGLWSCGGAVEGTPGSEIPSPPEQPTISVFPPQWLTLTPSVTLDVTAAVIRGLEESGGVFVQAPETVASELASHEDSCAEDVECLRRIGQKLGSDKTIAVHLAELGSTTLVKMSVLDVGGDGRETVQQATVSPTTAEGVEEAVQEMAREVGLSLRTTQPIQEPQMPPERRWYQRWWVWTLISAGIVGTTVGVVVPLVVDNDEDPSGIIITPP